MSNIRSASFFKMQSILQWCIRGLQEDAALGASGVPERFAIELLLAVQNMQQILEESGPWGYGLQNGGLPR